MTLVDVTVEGLRARVRGLRADMESWLTRTDGQQGDLPRHHSQVRRLGLFLESCLVDALRGTPGDLGVEPPFVATVDDVPALRRSVGTIHLLWDFYRDKLAQRDMRDFVAHLDVADDLAHACYRPFLRAAIDDGALSSPAAVKEPPLVCYATDRTPFAKARSRSLHPAGLDAKDVAQFAEALLALPVPVIGLPWETANRMPETALVGHEAGHVIAEDLGLAAEARTALAGMALTDDAGDRRKDVWGEWCDEVFADVLGVLATGSAFVTGLTAELVGGRADVRQAPITPASPGAYPTPTLRMALCAELLTRIGLTAPAEWSTTYGPLVGDSRAYRDDVPVVATTLLDRDWAAIGGKRLATVLPWDAEREEAARKVARSALDREQAEVGFDVRTWVAAATHARRIDPRRYAALDLDARLAAEIERGLTDRVRSNEVLRGGPGVLFGPGPVSGVLDELDRRAGAELARTLGLTQQQ